MAQVRKYVKRKGKTGIHFNISLAIVNRVTRLKCEGIKSIFLFFVSMLMSCVVFSQLNYSLVGRIKPQGESVNAATILLLNKDSVITRSAIPDRAGEFRFMNLDSGHYILSISHTGFQPYFSNISLEGSTVTRDLGLITLERSVVVLTEVTVQAQKPIIEYKNDRVVFNVTENMQKASRNSVDLLNKAPGVVVGRDNKIQIDGQSNILVMVNGKQKFSSVAEAVQFLSNIPAEQIVSIEVVQQPSAKYDQSAAGGILNIVLLKDETQGVQGNWNSYFNAGTYNRFGTGLNLNYRKKNLNLYALYNYNRDIQYETADNRQVVSGYILDQDYNVVKKPDYHNIRMGADLKLNKNNVVGLLANITGNQQEIGRHTNTYYHPPLSPIDSVITINEDQASKYDRLFLNFNYNGNFANTSASSLNFDVSYLNDDLRNQSEFFHSYYNRSMVKIRPDLLLFNKIPTLVDLLVFRLEYTQKLKKDINFEAGIKSTFSTTDNDVRYDTIANGVFITDESRTNHYVYRENVNAAYVSFSRFTKKTGWLIGLRYENAEVRGKTIGESSVDRTFNAILPNLSFRYTIDKNSRLTVTLRKIVGRPDFIKLNPFIRYVNQTFYYQGNPDLKQFNIYISSLKYTYKKYSLTLRYDYTSNYIPQELFVREGSSFVTRATYANAADLHGLQVTLYAPFSPFKWWSSYNNINIFHGTVKSRDTKYTGLDFTNTSANFSSANIFMLPFKIFGELNMNMSTKSRNNQTIFKSSYGIDIRLTKNFVNDKLKLSAVFDDITYHSMLRGYSEYNGIINNFDIKNDTRRIGIAISFQFGHKKVAERRQRSVGTEDEESRIKKF